ncbi:AbgT family transporter [Clostridium polynesiense]|uniref:AbgT family transporter n=1 Tax=Clostridium polynesiense TaxID=1325933 RepID=UPI00058BD006
MKKKKGLFLKFLDGVEKVGNALPHPVTIFLILCAIVAVASHIVAMVGTTVTYQGIDPKTFKAGEVTVKAVSLLTPEGIRYIFTSAVNNFTSFAPLGTVLVAMLGVGVAEGSGLISTALRRMVLSTPKTLITVIVVFAGVMSNVASDAGYVVLVPLGAIIFASVGRHPIAGLAAAFAGVSGGFSANLMIGTIDPLLAGISTEAAHILRPDISVTPTANLYFMFISTFVITALGTFVTEKIVEPRLGEYKGKHMEVVQDLTSEEKRGLKFALISLIVFIAAILFLTVPASAILRDPKTGEILGHSPFMNSIVLIIALFFFVPGVAYGIGARTIKNDKDIVNGMAKAMSSMGSYLVLTFIAAQFVAYFNYTKLGTIIAVKGADALQAIGLKGIGLILLFVLLTAFINLFMGSASAKWAIMAPIFVPMLMGSQFSPDFIQIAYRIGDSTTNIISPLMSYFAVIVAFAAKYDEDSGIGTLISTMVPYTIVFLLGWSALLIVWYFAGWPIGPGAGIHLLAP